MAVAVVVSVVVAVVVVAVVVIAVASSGADRGCLGQNKWTYNRLNALSKREE